MAALAATPGNIKPLKVCILWHMHQPDYLDPISGQTLLPWTWLHGVKDYGEMLDTIVETDARVTVNLVPSLLEQLERYSNGTDHDRWLDILSRKPEELADTERQFMVEHFFSVNEETQILAHTRYHELFRQRGKGARPDALNFNEQDLLDLQVWFLLAWTGHYLRQKSTLVAKLLQQGTHFREEQKQQLLSCCNDEVKRVLQFHRQLEESGQIEISVTPYAHPILPLLCDLHTAQEASPGLPLPAATFRYPEDARLQVREGLKTAERIFGQRQRGMWPAEGGVSEAAVTILAEEGALWGATDEDILARSLNGGLSDRSKLYQPYEYNGLPLLFRDRELSDRIGFLYASWDGKEAVKDLLQRLHTIARLAPGGTVAIILDGENCWERYPDNGYPFLRDLYLSLNLAPDLQMETVQEALSHSEPRHLDRLAPGSWIRSDFTTWVGHSEENLAWELLHQARQDTVTNEIHHALEHPDEPLTDLVRELLRAEGSDWFWWYGDEHASAQAEIFDQLFRRHLEGLYQLQGLSAPAHLFKAIKPVSVKAAGFEPTACFTPEIDGLVGDYFEWLAAGCIELSVGGAMYASRESLQKLHYGYDAANLYFRIDQIAMIRRLAGQKGIFEIRLMIKELFYIRYNLSNNILEICRNGQVLASGEAASDQVLEMAVPLDKLELHPGDMVTLSCHVYKDKRENGRWPTEGSASFCYRGAVLDEENWLV
ncbi:Alpha-amylase/alpha-mannosidase, GH57 family [Desulfuromusa kysingii]|uniref:Alpha-amylase/alpha-mannosidase, GH57 family n=1 Tax=Desulfuromusa kysingii TaxID=37625 RepID=A0A1H3XD97_9BACT|nr:glycoside hydrolase family 57 protein [Desulfuromusa kysingii]SDZ96654.1 Alpha-amylase/alpha-mannosidase, GH57 family [Desulfuromusa kysingii]